MEKNEFQIVDYLDEARSRVTEQFKDKDIFDRYLRLLISEAANLQFTMRDLMQLRSIDTAQGKQLDIIGEIVGRPRGLIASDAFSFFGFDGDPQSGKFGSLTDPQAGAPFWSLGSPKTGSRVPSDEEYRLLIKAKIIKNTTRSTPEDTIKAFSFLFGAGQCFIDEYAPAKARIGIGKFLTPIERALLFEFTNVGGLLPKTVGVEYDFVEFQSDRVFATLGYVDSADPVLYVKYSVGDLNNPDVGGYLSNLI